MRVSVIVPTLNSESSIGRCLESVRHQAYGDVEIIVVDGGSSDQTVSLAAKSGAVILRTLLRRSSARREGVARSTGQYLLFVDSDQVLSNTVIEACVSIVPPDSRCAAIIPEADLGEGIWVECRDLERRLFDSQLLRYPRFWTRVSYSDAGGHLSGLEDFMEDRSMFLAAQGAGVRILEANSVLYNDWRGVALFQQARRRYSSAKDADTYFRANAVRGESVPGLLGLRARALLKNLPRTRLRPRVGCAFPFYLIIAHLPRLFRIAVERQFWPESSKKSGNIRGRKEAPIS